MCVVNMRVKKRRNITNSDNLDLPEVFKWGGGSINLKYLFNHKSLELMLSKYDFYQMYLILLLKM